MKPTCNFAECQFAKVLKLKKPDGCPNYMDNLFTPQGPGADPKPVLIQDCAPRRTLLMLQELYNRDIGMQAALEQQRNVSVGIVQKFNQMIDEINSKIRGKQRITHLKPIEIEDGKI